MAVDDALVERFPRCLLCLAPAQSLDAFVIGGIIMTISRCHKCRRADPQGLRVIERLGKRER